MATTPSPEMLALIKSADVDALRAALVASLSVDLNNDLYVDSGWAEDNDCGHNTYYSSYAAWIDRDDQIFAITDVLKG